MLPQIQFQDTTDPVKGQVDQFIFGKVALKQAALDPEPVDQGIDHDRHAGGVINFGLATAIHQNRPHQRIESGLIVKIAGAVNGLEFCIAVNKGHKT